MKKIASWIWKWRWPLVCLIGAGGNAFFAGMDYGAWTVGYVVAGFIFGFGFATEFYRVMGPKFQAELFNRKVTGDE
jgi:hypothetical protein